MVYYVILHPASGRLRDRCREMAPLQEDGTAGGSLWDEAPRPRLTPQGTAASLRIERGSARGGERKRPREGEEREGDERERKRA